MTYNQNIMPQQQSQLKNQFSYFNNVTPGATASTNNIIWVQGIEGAKAWQLNPNSMVILLDSEAEGKMYIKVSDNIGMSSLRIFNYTEENINENNNVTANKDLDLSQYVRKDELSIMIKEIMKNEQIISTAATNSDSSGNDGTPAANKSKGNVTILKK